MTDTMEEPPATSVDLFGNAIEMVREFHDAMGLPNDMPSRERNRRRLRSLGARVAEEAFELSEAVQSRSSADTLKELADVLYSALGVAVALDLSVDHAFTRLHRLRRVDPLSQFVVEWPPLSLDGEEVFARAMQLVRSRTEVSEAQAGVKESSDAWRYVGELAFRLERSSRELRNSLTRRDLGEGIERLTHVLYAALEISVSIAVPIGSGFSLVHRNNMTKERAGSRGGVVLKPTKGDDYVELRFDHDRPSKSRERDRK